ncbi:MAG: hypothetical protein HW390_118 [Candidatus Brocadiaceae bacterium]|nr:hypothetical protein [Candidatus Brocadiaceae bacterium]
MAEKKTFSKTDFNLFREYIESRTGIHMDEGKQNYFAMNLDTRMHALGLKDYSAYYTFLTTSTQGAKEFSELLDLVLIKETFFFRDERQINTLIHNVLPALREKKNGKEIKIWSAGCATGEEPYTLAMVIKENFPAGAINFSIYATDISAGAVSYARNGVYGKGSMRAIDKLILNKYFVQKDGRYHLLEELKQLIHFDVVNLVEPYLPIGGNGFDVIFCKNVIIYFELETIKKVIHRFYDTLASGGYFFVGHSESLWQVSNEFTLEEISGVFLYRKNAKNYIQSPSELTANERPASYNTQLSALSGGSSQQYRQRQLSNNAVSGIKENSITNRKTPSFSQPSQRIDTGVLSTHTERKAPRTVDGNASTREKLRILLKRGLSFTGDDDEEILEDIQTIIEKDPKNTDAHLFLGKIYANMGLYDKALRKAADVLDIDDLNADAYELTGSVYYKSNENEKAIVSFKRAIYLNEKTLLSHYYLGNLYKDANLFRQAVKEYKNVMRAVETDSLGDEWLVGEVFTVKQLNEICSRNVELLSAYV